MRKTKNSYPGKPAWFLRTLFLMSFDLNEPATTYERKNI